MPRLAAQIEDEGGELLRRALPHEDVDLSDTPEGRAVLAMAPALARRVIPELAVPLVRREWEP